MNNLNKQAILEGLLFVVGEDGLTLSQIVDILEISDDDAKALVQQLREAYQDVNRGIRIDFLGNRFKLTTKKEHKTYYQKLLENHETNLLSQSALETLAIIAYNQPVTRITVDEIRGVSSAQMIRRLVAKGLIKEGSRSDLPGRPILYETTSEFLDYFALSSIEELPKIDFSSLEVNENQETDLYLSKYKEESTENEAEVVL